MRHQSLLGCIALFMLVLSPSMLMAAEQSNTTMQSQSNLMNMKISQLEGKQVVNKQGQELGKVDKVVQNKRDNNLQAVVSIGGFLGIGARQITVPMNELSHQQGKLVWDQSFTKDELKQRVAYEKSLYQDVNQSNTVAQLSNNNAERLKMKFEALDTNHDGYISPEEAQAQPNLANMYKQADHNADDKIDESEFSAFEETQPSKEKSQPTESGSMKQQPSSGGNSM